MVQLIVITLAATIPDFDVGIGVASIFALAQQYDTTTGRVNNLTANWSIFLLGWGSVLTVPLVRRYGRLPVLFWSQLLTLGFLVGCTFAPNLKTFAAMRCLAAFFGSCPLVTGLYVVTDMYPIHRQARNINIWALGFLASSSVSPFLFGFLVAKTSWRWSYGIGSIYSGLVLLLIVFFGRETLFDRGVKGLPPRPADSLIYRFETLVGVTGVKLAKYRVTWLETLSTPFKLIWRPHLLLILILEAVLYSFCIGIFVTNAVFLGSPRPFGFGFSQYAVAGAYATPIVGIVIGELIGHYANDAIMRITTRRNNGIFEAESRLWALYIGMPLYICGFVVLGAAFEKHLSVGAVVMGWGISLAALIVNTVPIYAYANDCFPKYQGEISALLSLARVLVGFGVPYFQVPWSIKHGAMQTLGCEAAIATGFFLLIVPALQLTGKTLRGRFSC